MGDTDADFFHLCFLSLNKLGSSAAPGGPIPTSPEELPNVNSMFAGWSGMIQAATLPGEKASEDSPVHRVLSSLSIKLKGILIGLNYLPLLIYLTIHSDGFFFSTERTKE